MKYSQNHILDCNYQWNDQNSKSLTWLTWVTHHKTLAGLQRAAVMHLWICKADSRADLSEGLRSDLKCTHTRPFFSVQADFLKLTWQRSDLGESRRQWHIWCVHKIVGQTICLLCTLLVLFIFFISLFLFYFHWQTVFLHRLKEKLHICDLHF